MNGVKLMKSRFPDFDTGTIDYRIRAIRTNKHKFIWKIDHGKELYDLQADPNELNNIADQHPQVCDKLHAILANSMKQMPSKKIAPLMQGKDPENLKMLRSLGYIE